MGRLVQSAHAFRSVHERITCYANADMTIDDTGSIIHSLKRAYIPGTLRFMDGTAFNIRKQMTKRAPGEFRVVEMALIGAIPF